MAEFEIKVTELEAGGKDYSFPLRASWLASELESLGEAARGLSAPKTDGLVEVYAQKTGADVVVNGRVKGSLLAECSRCLGPAIIPIAVDIGVVLSARGAAPRTGGIRETAELDDLTPDEVDREFFSGDVIDLANLVREHLLLEVPMQPLCREDCPGIEMPASQKKAAAAFAVKPAVDPRLAALGDIQLPSAPAGAADRSASPTPAEPKKRSKRSS